MTVRNAGEVLEGLVKAERHARRSPTDAGGRVTAIQWSGPNGSPVLRLTYMDNDAGNTTQVVDETRNQRVWLRPP